MAELMDTLRSEADALYAPQIANYQNQLAVLPGQFDAKRTALDQARRNAFRVHGEESNARNLFYSGLVPTKHAEYVGGTYTPALAQIGADQMTAANSLIDILNNLLIQKGSDVASRYDTRMQNETNNQLSREALEVQRRISLL